MKKLFISCPMHGRTEENISETYKRLRMIAEAFSGEPLEVIDSYHKDLDIPEGASETERRLAYLGDSIRLLGQADIVIGCPYYDGMWPGCETEMRAADAYGIRTIALRDHEIYDMFPDMQAIVSKRWSSSVCYSGGEKVAELK